MELEISLKVEIKQQDIDDIMVTALEGGITYWCDECVVEGEYLGKYASDQISRGGTLRLHEIDGDWQVLTKDKFMKGLATYIKNHGGVELFYYNELDVGNIDADAADSIIQYALFDDIVYG